MVKVRALNRNGPGLFSLPFTVNRFLEILISLNI